MHTSALLTPGPVPGTVHAVRGALRPAVAAVLCLAAASSAVGAQPQNVYFDSVDVPVVEVEVAVT